MLKRNLIKLFIPLAALAALATAIPVLPALAAPRWTTLQTVQGKVTGITGTTIITIEKADNTPFSVSVNGTTKYYLVSMGPVKNFVNNQVKQESRQNNNRQSRAGAMKELHIPSNWRDNLGWLDNFNKAASFSDIAVGDRVIARVDPNNNNTATQVLIVKATVIRQVKGNIVISTDPQPKTILVTPADGSATVLLTWDGNTEFIIKGTTIVPASGSGVVTYNSNTKIAVLVNLAGQIVTTP
jgi:hypothetical protein